MSRQSRIQEAYGACYRLAVAHGASQWLCRALDSARAEERGHRSMGMRFTEGQARYALPVADAARYFAVRWFLDEQRPLRGFDDACSLREDALYAYGARDRVINGSELGFQQWRALGAEYADVLAIDYAGEIAL